MNSCSITSPLSQRSTANYVTHTRDVRFGMSDLNRETAVIVPRDGMHAYGMGMIIYI
jgi:hypothetical protein